MPSPEQMNDLLLQLVAQQGQPQQAQQQQAPSKGLLSGLSQPLISGALTGAASALNPNSVSPIASGLVGGLQGFDARQQTDIQNRRAQTAEKQKQLQGRLDNILNIGKFGVSSRAEERLQKSAEFTENRQDLRHLVDPNDGSFIQNVLQTQDGRFIGDNGADITQEILSSGARVVNPSAPRTNVNTTVQAPSQVTENRFNKQYVDRVVADAPKIQTFQAALSNAKTAERASMNAVSGVGGQTLFEAKSLLKTGLAAVGQEGLAERIEIGPEGTLGSTVPNAMKPFILEQPRFTDADREASLPAVANLSNTRDLNIFVSRVNQANALYGIDKGLFDRRIAGELSTGERDNPAISEEGFNAYQRDLPRSKNVNGEFQVIDDGAQLWQYYSNGRPRSFTVQGSGGEMDMPLSVLKAKAKERGQSLRELLAQMEFSGKIIGVK